jgi:uncharacterized integral membrane protein
MTQSRGPQIPETGDEEASVGARIRMGAGVVAVAALALFFLQNLQEVQLHFLWFDWHTRLLWALLASAAAGGVATWLFEALRRRARRARAQK